MRCLNCPYRQSYVRAALPVSVCGLSGAQVAEFSFCDARTGGERQTDDPDILCPITLHRLLRTAPDRELATAILRMVAAHGALELLLSAYGQRQRAQLEALVA